MGSLVGGVNLMNKERTDAMKNKSFKGAFEGKKNLSGRFWRLVRN